MPLRGENRDRPTYERLRPLDGAGNSIVHVGHHAVFGIPCVQKTVDTPGREDAVAFAEPRLLKEFDHPHIVKVLEAQYDPHRRDAITIVMPEYEGGSLRDRLDAGRASSVGETISLLAQ